MAEKHIGLGISYINIPNFHIVRIGVYDVEEDFENTFVLGSILNAPASKGSPMVKGQTLRSKVRNIEKGVYNIHPNIDGQKHTLIPMWLSNGIFFGPDGASDVMGPVVQNQKRYKGLESRLKNYPRRLYSPNPKLNKIKRWMYLQNLDNNGEVNYSFQRLNSDTTAATLAASWNWAIGGAGILVENGKPHTVPSYWNNEVGGNFNADDQYYSTGPIIAENNNPNKKVLYLIMNTQPAKIYPWSKASKYLSEDFMGDIGHGQGSADNDGKIRTAIVYDGASARQLWIRKRKSGVGPGYVNLNARLVPHYICLWGEAINL